jgi:hypothetical protein
MEPLKGARTEWHWSDSERHCPACNGSKKLLVDGKRSDRQCPCWCHVSGNTRRGHSMAHIIAPI